MTLLATSLERMAASYPPYPAPVRPSEALQMALGDVRAAALYAAQGKVWVKAGVWKKAE